MVNQKIKRFIEFLIFSIGFSLYSSEQEKTYQLVFVEKNPAKELVDLGNPITVTQDQLDQIDTIKSFLLDFPSEAPQENQRIPILVGEDDLKQSIRRIFQEDILPVITKFIEIKNRSESDYFKIISLINSVKDYDYETLKNALTVMDYLQVSLIVMRAFANACYDKRPEYLAQKARKELDQRIVKLGAIDNKEYYKNAYDDDVEAPEKAFIDTLKNKGLLISLLDLPEALVDTNDFINKGLRSLDGIKQLIKDEHVKESAFFVDFRKNFNFKQNFIQDVDPLRSLVSDLRQENITNCRFIIYLGEEKLSKKAKEICKQINQPIGTSKFSNRFESLQEADLIPNNSLRSLKMRISNIVNGRVFSSGGFVSTVGLHAWLTWKFNSFFSNKITYLGKQILSPRLFKKFENIPLKALPLTLLMIKLTWRQYYTKVAPSIEKIILFPINRMLQHKQLINPHDLKEFPSVSMYIMYDK